MKTWRVSILVAATLSGACAVTPTEPSPLTAPGTRVLVGTVYPDGATTMWVTTQAGTLTVTLTDPKPTAIALGLGLGVRNLEHCDLTAQANTQGSSTPQITTPVAAGTYCVEVSDMGVVSSSGAPFSVSVPPSIKSGRPEGRPLRDYGT